MAATLEITTIIHLVVSNSARTIFWKTASKIAAALQYLLSSQRKNMASFTEYRVYETVLKHHKCNSTNFHNNTFFYLTFLLLQPNTNLQVTFSNQYYPQRSSSIKILLTSFISNFTNTIKPFVKFLTNLISPIPFIFLINRCNCYLILLFIRYFTVFSNYL